MGGVNYDYNLKKKNAEIKSVYIFSTFYLHPVDLVLETWRLFLQVRQ